RLAIGRADRPPGAGWAVRPPADRPRDRDEAGGLMEVPVGRTKAWSDRAPIRHLDPALLVATGALALIGLFMVFSATHQSLVAVGADPWAFVKKQIVALVVGGLLLVGAAAFDYRLAKVYAPLIYGGMLFLLLLVR